MKNVRKYIALITSLLIATVAAYFSITGISKLFAGSAIQVIIMASFLELGKIVTVSFLQTYWDELKWSIKGYLSFAVIILMIITAAGIYGFLTNAYQETANKFGKLEKQVEIIDKKENLIKSEIKRYEDAITTKNQRLTSLTLLRTKQEDRIDNMLNSNKNTSARMAQSSIKEGNEEIKSTNEDISSLNTKINVLNDSIGSFENQKLALTSSDITSEIGPLKYIATLTGYPMDKVVNWFTIMIVIVFDPLAIFLLRASQSIKGEKKEGEPLKKQEIVEKKEEKEPDTSDLVVSNTPASNDTFDVNETAVEKKEETLTEESNRESFIEEHKEKEPVAEKEIEELKEEGKSEYTQTGFEKFYENQITNMNKYKSKFDELISILYDNGVVNSGENLLNFIDFKNKVDELFVQKYSNEDIKRFLTVCNYLKITSLNEGERKALVSLEEAKRILNIFYNNN